VLIIIRHILCTLLSITRIRCDNLEATVVLANFMLVNSVTYHVDSLNLNGLHY